MIKRNEGVLRDKPEDFAEFGIDKDKMQVWEDGKRLPQTGNQAGDYEWWYMDAHLDDGSMLVLSYMSNYGENDVIVPSININYVSKDRLIDENIFKPEVSFSAATESCDVKIGKSFFKGEGLDKYHIYLDEEYLPGFSADVTIERLTPSNRPGTGFWQAGEAYFAWFNAVPYGKITGTVTIDGEVIEISGSGYHDHNWGNVPMNELLGNWYWGRAEVDGYAVVAASVRFNEASGSKEQPVLYVAKGDELVINACNDQIAFLQGDKTFQKDMGKAIDCDNIYLVENERGNAKIRFNGNKNIVASMDVPTSDETFATWYTRFASDTTIEVNFDEESVTSKGPSVLEYIDFFAFKK